MKRLARYLAPAALIWLSGLGSAGAQMARLVKDVGPGASSSAPQGLANANGTLFFAAEGPAEGSELWTSDGTKRGTVLVSDIRPGPRSSNPLFITERNGVAYFFADDGASGLELWRSDGTAAGTSLVIDINPGPGGSSPQFLTHIGGTLYFGALSVLWKSDGTASGTAALTTLTDGLNPGVPVEVNGTLFFAANDSQGRELWSTDGMSAARFADIEFGAGDSNPEQLFNFNGTLFFSAFTTGVGRELRKVMGPSVVLIKDINFGPNDSSPAQFANLNGTLYFAADDGQTGRELWSSDGAGPGTGLAADIEPLSGRGSSPRFLINAAARLLFVADTSTEGAELWSFDGFDAVLVRDIEQGPGGSNPENLTLVGDIAYFSALKSPNGVELWRTNGGEPGTSLLQDINPAGDSSPGPFVMSGANLFFPATDASGRELWAIHFGIDFFTATSTSGQNELEWINPVFGAAVKIRFKTTGFPSGPNDPTATPLPIPPGSPGQHRSFLHSGLTNGQTYFYGAFVDDGGAGNVGKFIEGRPQNTFDPEPTKWIFSSGAFSLSAPSIGSVYTAGNDGVLHSMKAGSDGGDWPDGWRPFAAGDSVQVRSPVVRFPISPFPNSPGTLKAVFFSSLDGHLHAVDGDTGALIWKSPDLGDAVLAAPTATFRHLRRDYDLLFVGTRNASSTNTFYALNVADGSIAWQFSNGGGANGIGIVNGQGSVDLKLNRVYFTSHEKNGGSNRTVWCLEFTDTAVSLVWAAAVGSIDGSPVIYTEPIGNNKTVYVGTRSGRVRALLAEPPSPSGQQRWSRKLGDGSVKGYVFPRPGTSDLFVSTTNTVWSLRDDGGSGASINWSVTGLGSPSIPLFMLGRSFVLFGSANGNLYQIDISTTPLTIESVIVGDGGATVGSPSLDLISQLIFVGTEAGTVHAIRVPLP